MKTALAAALLIALTAGQAQADDRLPIIVIVPAEQPKLTIEERVAKSVAAANRAGERAVRRLQAQRYYEQRTRHRR